MPLDLEKEPDSRMRRFLRRGKEALDGPGIGALEGTQSLQDLGFSLGEGGSMVLSEVALDSASRNRHGSGSCNCNWSSCEQNN